MKNIKDIGPKVDDNDDNNSHEISFLQILIYLYIHHSYSFILKITTTIEFFFCFYFSILQLNDIDRDIFFGWFDIS